jgi:iron complex transport system substrate-binding protein
MLSSARCQTLLGCILLLFNACAENQATGGLRIVSLSPGMTEILFSLGAGDRLVGVTTFCDFPEEARKISKVGDFSHPSVERIVGLKPGLVIVNLPEQMRVKKQLDDLGMNVFVSSPHSLADIYGEILALGKELKLNRQADSLIEYMKLNLRPIETAYRKKVYVEISPRPIITIGADAFLNDLIHRAGGVNVFADLEKDYPVVSQEAVIARDPDVIIVLHPEPVAGRTGWDRISAFKSGRIYTGLDPDHLMRPGPRLVKGFQELEKIIND